MTPVELLAFDPSTDAELPAGWLLKPHVSRWWGDPEAQLGAVLERPVGGDDALIAFDGTPVGYVRWQLVPRSELEAAGIGEVPDGAVDIDIAIGEEAFVGRGIGPAALARAVARILETGRPPMIIMGTAVANGSALRAFAKAGFHPMRQFEDPRHGRFWLLRYTAGSAGALEEPAIGSPDTFAWPARQVAAARGLASWSRFRTPPVEPARPGRDTCFPRFPRPEHRRRRRRDGRDGGRLPACRGLVPLRSPLTPDVRRQDTGHRMSKHPLPGSAT